MVDGIQGGGLPPLRPTDPSLVGGGLQGLPASPEKGSLSSDNVSFKDLLFSALDNVNKMQMQADQAVQNLVQTGNMDKIPEVLTSIKKAEISFDALLQIRNKLIDAYQELSRMPI